ncbi:hypothetical protein V6N13_114355 [Hibiscus sabdariffa]
MRGMNFSETGVLEERLQINDALLTMRESVHLVIDCPFDRGWEAVGETSMHSLVTGNGLLTNSSCGIQKDEVMVMEKFKTDAANGKESCGETVKPSMFQTGVLGSNYTSVGQYVY